jgi:serine/threonine protein kinase
MSGLGKYTILQQLGTGSMGVVYRARDKVLQRDVALKMMRAESQIDPEIVERFFREARACAQLQHPNIITVYDFGQADEGKSFIVMELLDGTDWRNAIGGGVNMPLGLKLDLMAQVCEGLAHAHRHGIVHRDIKPSNLFIHLKTQSKIVDFGIARLPLSNLTRTGKVLGTPNYMAPEQITGERCDAQSDLFSAAIVFFELLTHCHPFKAPFIPRRIALDEPDQLQDIDPSIPIELQEIFSRAFAKDPARRYQTGDELAAALRKQSLVWQLASADQPGIHGTVDSDPVTATLTGSLDAGATDPPTAA